MIGGDLAARFSDFASVAVAKFSLDVLFSKAIAAKLSLNCDFSRLVIQLLNIAEAPLRIRFLRRHRSGLTRSLFNFEKKLGPTYDALRTGFKSGVSGVQCTVYGSRPGG